MQAVGCQSPASTVSRVFSMGDCYNARCHGVNRRVVSRLRRSGPRRRLTLPGSGGRGQVPSRLDRECLAPNRGGRLVTDQEGSTEPGAGSVGRPPTIIRITCLLLVVVGFLSVMFTAPAVFDAAGGRCQLARVWLDDANTDKKPWNNVDTGGRKAKDLPCSDAIRLAGQIRLKEKGTRTASVPGETALRIQSALTVVMGLGQAISATLVLRRLSRPARTAAIAF